MVMHLEGELLTRFDHDALYLEALAHVDAFVPAPGAEYASMEFVFAAAGRFQVVHDFFYILGVGLVGYQHGVRCFHDEQVGYADGGHHA